MKITKVEVTVPAGQYVLGDPCYAVPDRLWNELLNSCNCFNSPIGVISKGGNKNYVLGFGTCWGDGYYRGSNGLGYAVDAGLIGLVPIDIVENVSELEDFIVNFDSPTVCKSNGNGKLSFGSIVIDTDPEYEPEEEEND